MDENEESKERYFFIPEENEKHLQKFSRCFGKTGVALDVGDEWVRLLFPTVGRNLVIHERDGRQFWRDEDPEGKLIEAILRRYEDLEETERCMK